VPPRLDVSHWNLAALAESWRAARPFSHVIVDGLVSEPALAELCQGISAEPHWPNRGEIYDMMASADEVQHPVLRGFHESLRSPEALAAVRAISGKEVRGADLRSYVYLQGSYLLPHSDCQTRLGRLVAYTYYVWTQGCRGGELELFDVTMKDGRAVETRAALQIEPRPNRLVLFEVTPASLHQVREVLGGARLSLAGWFVA
jgi:hypothetical protein